MWRFRLKARLMQRAVPRFRMGLRHAAVAQRLQMRSQAVGRRVARLTRQQQGIARRAAFRHSLGSQHLRAAFMRAAVAGLR